ncbi:collagen binding domain-containing protein, partial [Cellulomonas sp. 179-A 4D5 NHS]|uniref:MSCRAMM family protein n=1 Tax=Cellulomonas sp. 179-A 4D5 NHS TaxID=3142378 RepID=UPI00399F8791
AVLEVRNASCSTVFSRMRTGADGSFPVTAYPGQYCLVGVSAPAPFLVPGSQVFTVGGSGFSVPVALVGPSTGSVVVTGGGAPVAGAVLEVRNASCSTVFSRMRTGADGSFPVTAYPGQYCLVGVSAPAPFDVAGRQVFTVAGPGFTVPVSLGGPSSGSVRAVADGAPVPGVVVQVRNAACSATFSTMRTGADGAFPVVAYPGTYCLVPTSAPAGYVLPAGRTFTVAPDQRFAVDLTLARAR